MSLLIPGASWKPLFRYTTFFFSLISDKDMFRKGHSCTNSYSSLKMQFGYWLHERETILEFSKFIWYINMFDYSNQFADGAKDYQAWEFTTPKLVHALLNFPSVGTEQFCFWIMCCFELLVVAESCVLFADKNDAFLETLSFRQLSFIFLGVCVFANFSI